jgi:hypothetical protein
MAAMAVAMMAGGCAGEDDIGTDVGNANEAGYAFSNDDPHELEIIDHMGTALTSTSLVNRDDGYQSDAPNSIPYLVDFLRNLGKMHEVYAPQLENLGFEPCSLEGFISGKEYVTPCTQQSLWDGGPQVQDVVVPDSIEIHLDEPPSWPNGRPILTCSATGAWATDEACAAQGGEMQYVQVNDLVLAMGFLDIGAKCEGAPGGVCQLDTFVKLGLNIDHNDKALPNEFPYLAPPHL